MIRVVAQTAATKLAVLALGAGTGVLLARALGPQGRGSYQVAVVIASAAMVIGHLSVEQAQIALWPDESKRERLHRNAARLGMLVGTASAVITAVVCRADTLTLLALASVPFTTGVVYLNGTLILRSRMDVVNRGSLIAAGAQCVALVWLTLSGTVSVWWVVAVWTGSHVLHLCLLGPVWRGSLDRPLAVASLRIGGRFHAGSASLFLLQRVDFLLLNAFAGPAAVGLYSVAVTVAELVRLLADPVTQAALPGQATANERSAAAATAHATKVACLAAAASAVLLGVMAIPVVPLVYGDEFRGSVLPLLVLLPGLALMLGIKPISSWLLRTGRPHQLSATYLGALALNVTLNVILVPRYGVAGCAAAASASYGLLAALHTGWFLLRRKTSFAVVPQQQAQARPEHERHREVAQGVGK